MRWRSLLVLLTMNSASALAELVHIEVSSRADLSYCEARVDIPCYESLSGRIEFAIDPGHPANGSIVDVEYGPTDPEGLVRFAADFHLLKPKNVAEGNGALVFEVPNRGRKGILPQFNRGAARSADPRSGADFGDGFLQRHGYSILWVGWQSDVPPNADRMRAYLPAASGSEARIEGLVRSDFHVDERVTSHALGDRGHVGIPVADPADRRNVLTVRDSAYGERQVLPRDSWRFARVEAGAIVPDPRHVYRESGFEPGHVYELVYVAQDPPIAGLGLAAIRDAVAFLKHSQRDSAGRSLGRYDRALAYGASQSGRVLRSLIYEGFNRDELGRRVFDGVLSHIAGGQRGGFNIRFAQPSRSGEMNFYYPTGMFPFADSTESDEVSGRRDGLLAEVDPAHLPRIFYTNSSTEYWISSAALSHTTVDGSQDLPQVPTTRTYHFAGTQHGPAPFPESIEMYRTYANPNDYGWFLRSLLLKLDAWVRTGAEPPESRIPSVKDASLVPVEAFRFPHVPGLSPPDETPVVHRLDYGPRFLFEGIADIEPPRVGAPYPRLVPAVDGNGNELGGLKSPELAVPLGTYTGWQAFDRDTEALFVPLGYGIFMPFARTSHEKQVAQDPRSAIEELYESRQDYMQQVERAAQKLAAQGYLLAEDLPSILKHAQDHWDRVMAAKPAVQQQ